MKRAIVLGSFLVIILNSCHKSEDIRTTFINLKTVHYGTETLIGNVNFNIIMQGGNQDYNVYDKTNDYGIYFGSFHSSNIIPFFDIENNQDTLLVNQPDILIGEQNEVVLELVAHSSLMVYFDCSGGGGIRNVSRRMLDQIPYDSPLYYKSEGTQTAYYPSCSNISTAQVYSGEWLIEYETQSSGSFVWQQKTDTILIEPGETYYHTIIY